MLICKGRFLLFKLFLVTIILACFSLPAQSALISIGTGDLNVVGSSVPETNRDEDNLVNGSGVGLVGDKIVSTTTQPNGNNWNTLTESADITFDLGAVYNIDFIHIWNFNDGFGNSDFGPESFKLLVSSVGSNAQNADFSGVSIIPTLSILHAPGQIGYFGANYRFNGNSESDIPTELGGDELYNLSFLQLKGRFVRLADLDGALKSFGGRAGLSEIRFYGTPVPLPAAVWLLGSTLLGLFFVGRKTKK
ncbi:MAG: VPLPA-CTERM sorting domain-containing protein [Gammaproteobacteria bacterium]